MLFNYFLIIGQKHHSPSIFTGSLFLKIYFFKLKISFFKVIKKKTQSLYDDVKSASGINKKVKLKYEYKKINCYLSNFKAKYLPIVFT